MVLRHLIVLAMLAGFAPVTLPFATIDKVEAAQTVKKKKKKVVQKNQRTRVKTNFRGPRPGEPMPAGPTIASSTTTSMAGCPAIANHMATASACGIGNGWRTSYATTSSISAGNIRRSLCSSLRHGFPLQPRRAPHLWLWCMSNCFCMRLIVEFWRTPPVSTFPTVARPPSSPRKETAGIGGS